jgi:hypothetical protein
VKFILTTSTPNAFLEKIAKKYHLKIKINKGEKGLAPDFNFALKQASTNIFTLAHHQDDVYLPNYTSRNAKNLANYSRIFNLSFVIMKKFIMV